MKAWEDFLLSLEGELGVDTVKKWLRSLQVVRFDACNLFLEAKDSFQALWFEEHIRKRVIENFVNNNHKKIRVHLAIVNRQGQTIKKPKTAAVSAPPSFQLQFDPLDPYCSFEHFIEQEENTLAVKVLKTEQGVYNPILLCGGAGVGKTHLLMAAASTLRDAGKKALYARSETFTEHVVSAIRSGEMRKFRETYRNVDALLIDDVHLFSRKGATQEELFHTFNTLHTEGKQLIFSANCYPKDLVDIEPRLVSRFEWGIVLPLHTPTNREPLLQKKAAALHFPLPPKVAEFLLESFKSSLKALMRSLEALILRSHVQRSDNQLLFRPMTVQLAKHYLADLLIQETQAALTPQKIIQYCAEQYGIRPEDILGKAQTRDCTEPRQLAMYLCRKELKLPYTKIGEAFGRDHSTVMTSIKQIESGLEQRLPNLMTALGTIEKKGLSHFSVS